MIDHAKLDACLTKADALASRADGRGFRYVPPEENQTIAEKVKNRKLETLTVTELVAIANEMGLPEKRIYRLHGGPLSRAELIYEIWKGR